MTDLRYINFFWTCAALALMEVGVAAYGLRIDHPATGIHCAFVVILIYLAIYSWSHRHDD